MTSPIEPRLPIEDTLIGLIGLDVDPPTEIGRVDARLPVVSGVCQPMGLVHGGIYAVIAETLASMGTGYAVVDKGGLPLGQANNTNFLRPISEGSVHAVATAFHRGRTSWVWDVEMRDDEDRLCAVRASRSRCVSVTVTNKVKVGFFSFTEVTDPAEHRAYNEWHTLDHMPEQFPLDGIAYGQRWVAPPVCAAARSVNEAPFDAVHYMTLYLMTEPVERTLREFYELGGDLRGRGRFHEHRRSHLSGPFRLLDSAAAPRVLISAEAVPYRSNRGVYVTVEETGDRSGINPYVSWLHAEHVPALLDVPGVVGVWSFATVPQYRDGPWQPGDRRVTVCWLDAAPLDVATKIDAVEAGRRRFDEVSHVTLSGPFETIEVGKWDWFDG